MQDYQRCVFTSPRRIGACKSDRCDQGRAACPEPLECADDGLSAARGCILALGISLSAWAIAALTWVLWK